jgi:hypothetical protein
MYKYYLDSWHLVLQALAKTMQVGDEHVFTAMHGQESTLDKPVKPEEPAAFFFVIFGLAYEALASSPLDSNLTLSTRQTTVIAALQALQSIVRPAYSGGVMMDTTISEEFISLCYRMAMTETASIQVHLVELLTVFASNQGWNLGHSRNGRSVYLLFMNVQTMGLIILPETIPPCHLPKLIVCRFVHIFSSMQLKIPSNPLKVS